MSLQTESCASTINLAAQKCNWPPDESNFKQILKVIQRIPTSYQQIC